MQLSPTWLVKLYIQQTSIHDWSLSDRNYQIVWHTRDYYLLRLLFSFSFSLSLNLFSLPCYLFFLSSLAFLVSSLVSIFLDIIISIILCCVCFWDFRLILSVFYFSYLSFSPHKRQNRSILCTILFALHFLMFSILSSFNSSLATLKATCIR